jgi:hypothetical protein
MNSLSDKDIQKARRLAKALKSGTIPVNDVRNFLERIGREGSPAQSTGKRGIGKKTLLKNRYKSML